MYSVHPLSIPEQLKVQREATEKNHKWREQNRSAAGTRNNNNNSLVQLKYRVQCQQQ